MEVIRAKDAHRIENGDTCVAHEYGIKDLELNIARIEIRGRFPKEGMMRNTLAKEIVYVEEGEGSVSINNVAQEIGKGDVILYEKGEEVFWEGTLTLITACTPAWTPDQHEILT